MSVKGLYLEGEWESPFLNANNHSSLSARVRVEKYIISELSPILGRRSEEGRKGKQKEWREGEKKWRKREKR